MKYQFVINVIQLQLYHYQLYTYEHAIKVIITTRTYQWTHDMVANENRFKKVSLEVKVTCIFYLGLFGINNGMEFMFSIFWTF
jgi:hypothetical protein